MSMTTKIRLRRIGFWTLVIALTPYYIARNIVEEWAMSEGVRMGLIHTHHCAVCRARCLACCRDGA